jgi:hypothetical protein
MAVSSENKSKGVGMKSLWVGVLILFVAVLVSPAFGQGKGIEHAPTIDMPKMATGRDYLDNPASLNGLNQLYKTAGPSLFMVPSAGRQQGEKLVPIAQSGQFGATSTGDDGRDDSGKMHATATIPSDSQAIIHTHPAGQDPLPSDADYATATKIGKPNFVMTKDAIYVAMPGGSTKNPIKVADISHGKGGKLNIKWN